MLWTAVPKSGVHATLAGVIVGFFIPLKENTVARRPLPGACPAPVGRVPDPLPLFSLLRMPVFLQGVTIDGLTYAAVGKLLPVC